MGDLSPLLICLVEALAGKRCPTPITAGGRAVPDVVRVEELSLPLSSWRTGRVAPIPCVGNRVDLVLKVRKTTLWMQEPENSPHPLFLGVN